MLNQLGGHAWIEISRKSVESMKLCEIFFESLKSLAICILLGLESHANLWNLWICCFLRLRDVGFFAIYEVFFCCDQNFFPGEDSYLVNENGGAKCANEDEQGASPKG